MEKTSRRQLPDALLPCDPANAPIGDAVPADRRRRHHAPFKLSALRRENACFQGSAGVSAANRALGFRPAFLDRGTQAVYLSRFANGEPAPFHLLDGLPPELVLARGDSGRVTEVKGTLVSGFVLGACFYDREAAARRVADGA